MRELNACEVPRLNQLNSTFAVSATETVEDSTWVRLFDLGPSLMPEYSKLLLFI